MKITCVIPVFNATSTLRRAVASCLQQRGDFEIILVDDCSTDGSHQLALDIAAEANGRIHVFKNDVNSGPALSRNRGALAASGQFLCFLDSDDAYLDGFFEKTAGILAANPDSAAVKTAVRILNPQGARALMPGDPRLKEASASYPCNMLVRKEVFFLLGAFPTDPRFRGPLGGEDDCFFMAMAALFRYHYVTEELVVHHHKPGDHLEIFLSRTSVQDGRVIFHQDGNHDAYQLQGLLDARREYAERARANILSVDSCHLPVRQT